MAHGRLAVWRYTLSRSTAVAPVDRPLRRLPPLRATPARPRRSATVCPSCGEPICPPAGRRVPPAAGRRRPPRRRSSVCSGSPGPALGSIVLGFVLTLASTAVGLIPPYLRSRCSTTS